MKLVNPNRNISPQLCIDVKILNNPRVIILLLNWNNSLDTIECLKSLETISYPNFDVIIVDNDSLDDSVQRIKDYYKNNNRFSKFIQISSIEKLITPFNHEVNETTLFFIQSPTNLGFTSGNNLGISFAMKNLDFSFILLLNNDTIVSPIFLSNLVKIAESDPKIGAIGPQIFYHDFPDTIQTMGSRMEMFSGRRKKILPEQVNSPVFLVDYLDGACNLLKRAVLADVGLMDPDFFFYVEDVDWGYRIRKKGYLLLVTTKAKIWHKVAKSTGGGYNPRVIYNIVKNDILFMKKHAKFYHWPSFLLISGFYLVKRIFFTFWKNPHKILAFLRGILHGSKMIVTPSFLGDFDTVLHKFLLKSQEVFTVSELLDLLGSPYNSVQRSLQRLAERKKVEIKERKYIYPKKD